jgi:pSer/pThr/pTyr-binding forkhead associated (FHA) protein
VLGRSRRCTIVLADPNVSRQHVEIRRQDDGFMLRDLGSTNGTRLNRRDVKQAVLQHGDRIELGTTELMFERLP